MRITSLTILTAALLLACQSDTPDDNPTPPELAKVLPNIPLPPRGEVESSEGSGNALQLLVSTPMPSDSVAEYYRGTLSRPPYRLINEATDRGTVTFYVEQDGPPLWVSVQGLEAGGTLVRLAGAAVADSAMKKASTAIPAPVQ